MKTYEIIEALSREIDRLREALFIADDCNQKHVEHSEAQRRADERATQLRYEETNT